MSVIFSLFLYPDCQVVLVELLVAMVSQRITANELALLIRLFLEKTAPIVSLDSYPMIIIFSKYTIALSTHLHLHFS